MLHIRIFWLFPFLTTSCLFTDIRGFVANLRPPPRRVHQAGPSRPTPFTPPARPQQQAVVGPSRSRERPAAGDKRKHLIEDPALENKRAAEPSGLMEPPGLQPKKKRVANIYEGRSSTLLSNGPLRVAQLLMLMPRWLLGSSHRTCS